MPIEKSYSGASGQLYVMSEFLARNYNVAIPIVDVGDDVLVIQDTNKELHRVQVKSSTNIKNYKSGNGFSVSFGVPKAQLESVASAETKLYYAFTIRKDNKWYGTYIIDKDILRGIREDYNDARDNNNTTKSDKYAITITIRNNSASAWGEDLNEYFNSYDTIFEDIAD